MLSQVPARSARRACSSFRAANLTLHLRGSRTVSTLPENPHIYVFKHPNNPDQSLLTLLPTSPPNLSLAIGIASSLPPSPNNFTENTQFLGILQSVFHTWATHDPGIQQQAAIFASPGGFSLGTSNSDGAGATGHQGGMGGGNRGGWTHVSDTRNPPDWGRIAWPEDIFGSLEVDGNGKFVDGTGNYQASGTYRVITREGILGIPSFLRQKLVERLLELEQQSKHE